MKAEKTVLIDHLLEKVNSSPFLFVVDYAKLTVPGWETLRKRLRDAGAEIHVFKNTFVRKAAEKAGYPAEIEKALIGQTAVVTGAQDVCAAAKVMKTFAKEFDKAKVKAGVLDGALLTAESINSLADLPSKPQLQAQLLALFNTPATQLVRVLNEPATGLVRVLKAKGENAE
jgi:large subunit ribosomal protein L10